MGILPEMVHGTNNRAIGFDSILLQSAVMYYDIMIYVALTFAFDQNQSIFIDDCRVMTIYSEINRDYQ